MCPSKRDDASTGLFVGFSRIPDVSAESFVPFARYAIEYFRDVFRLVSDSRIFIPLFLLHSMAFTFSLLLLIFYPMLYLISENSIKNIKRYFEGVDIIISNKFLTSFKVSNIFRNGGYIIFYMIVGAYFLFFIRHY